MSFVNERAVKAVRKARRCVGCSAMVNVGEAAISWAGVWDGEFSAAIYHPDCRAAEIALNRLHETFHSDEWMGLGDMEWEDHPWLLEEYPAVAARMNITAESVRTDREEAEACRAAWSRPASGMSAFGQDPKGLEAKPASPVPATPGDAQTHPHHSN